ncbi:MAG TPA: UPF0104 family protein [Halothiobacillaceae bacterium]|nr:UPF0104 family protein [Halothiobacillaceae bacterium]
MPKISPPPQKNRSSKASLSFWLALALPLALLLAVLNWVGFATLLAPWQAMSKSALLLAVALLALTQIIRTLRIYRYFFIRLRGHFWATLRLSIWHNLMNNLLPMRSGEAAFPVLMWRYFQIEVSASLPGLFWFRLLDLQVLMVLVLLAGGRWINLSGLVLYPLLAGLIILPFVVYYLRDLIFRLLVAIPLSKTQRHFRAGRLWLLKALRSLPHSGLVLLESVGWTWANWVLKLTVMAWVLMQFVDINFFQGLLGAIGGDLTSVLPVHAPGGFGTFEAGVSAALFSTVDDSKALLAAAVNLHLFVLGTAILAALLALLLPRP